MEEKAPHLLLVNDTTVSGLIGNRIYTQEPEQQPEFDYVVVSREDTEPLYSLSGKGKPDKITILVDVWSTHHDTGKTLAGAVKSALNGFRGTVGGILVYYLTYADTFDQEDTDRYHVVLSFNLYA